MQIKKNNDDTRIKLMGGFSTHFLEACFHYGTFAAMLFGGFALIAAFIAGFSGYEVADRLQKESDEKISRTNERAALIEREAAQANERAANAEQKAAEATLALEKIRSPRTFTLQQREAIIAKLKPFAGLKFDMLASGGDESVAFANKILEILREAGWIFLNKGGFIMGSSEGVVVRADSPLKDAANALHSALIAQGVEHARLSIEDPSQHTDPHIFLFNIQVHRKP